MVCFVWLIYFLDRIKSMTQQIYPLYNQDYQTHFKFGLDYRIFSKSAKAIEILNNNHLITITLGI